MKITVLGGDGYCGWATALYPVEAGPHGLDRGQLRAAPVGSRARGRDADTHPLR